MLGRRASCWGGVAVSYVLLPRNFSTWSYSQGVAVPQECWYLWSTVRQVNVNPAQCALPQPLNWQLGGIMPLCSWEILLLS